MNKHTYRMTFTDGVFGATRTIQVEGLTFEHARQLFEDSRPFEASMTVDDLDPDEAEEAEGEGGELPPATANCLMERYFKAIKAVGSMHDGVDRVVSQSLRINSNSKPADAMGLCETVLLGYIDCKSGDVSHRMPSALTTLATQASGEVFRELVINDAAKDALELAGTDKGFWRSVYYLLVDIAEEPEENWGGRK